MAAQENKVRWLSTCIPKYYWSILTYNCKIYMLRLQSRLSATANLGWEESMNQNASMKQKLEKKKPGAWCAWINRPFSPRRLVVSLQTMWYSLENGSFIHLKIIYSYARDYLKIWKKEFSRGLSHGLKWGNKKLRRPVVKGLFSSLFVLINWNLSADCFGSWNECY